VAEPPHAAHDEIDPELVRLRRRVPVGPILAASVLGFALLVMWRLRADFAFAGASAEPLDLGAVSHPAPLVDNVLVRLSGTVDATAPARVRGAQEAGHRVAPFLGTSRRIWLREDREPADTPASYDDRWTGRLRRLAATGFAAELEAYIAQAAPEPHVVTDLHGLPTRDALGDALTVAPTTRVDLEERVPGAARVVFVATDEIKDEPAARAALGALGFAAAPPVESEARVWIYEVAAEPADVEAKLRAARRFGAAAEPKLVAHEAAVADVDLAQPDVVRVKGAAIPRASVPRAVFWVKPTLPDEVWVLVVGDSPAGLWYTRPLYALLAVIVVLMILALAADLRHLRRPS
jgi:hypothetical protein